MFDHFISNAEAETSPYDASEIADSTGCYDQERIDDKILAHIWFQIRR